LLLVSIIYNILVYKTITGVDSDIFHYQ